MAVSVCLLWLSVHPHLSLELTSGQLWTLLYAACLVGFAAYALFTFANSRLPATVCTLYGILQPLLTSAFAFAFEGEPPSAACYVGGPLILGGLVLTTLATAHPPASADPLPTQPTLAAPLLPVSYSRSRGGGTPTKQATNA